MEPELMAIVSHDLSTGPMDIRARDRRIRISSLENWENCMITVEVYKEEDECDDGT